MSLALSSTVQTLRRLAFRSAARERTDRQLLERFAQTGDEAAFAAVVDRHGAMVLSVCRRVLGNVQDAEDAFQAVFLVLARKAGSQTWQDSVGNWLHGVSLRVALKARTAGARRRRRESQAPQPIAGGAEEQLADLRRVLDEELAKLPARYRAPLILCYLEGKTRDEAAEELGWSSGSVKGRLERGRELLKSRLEARKMTLPSVLAAGLLLDGSASASVPSALAAATVQAGVQFSAGPVSASVIAPSIVHLAQGALNAMLIAKIKISAFVLSIAGLFGLGTTFVLDSVQAGPDVAFAQDAQEGVRRADGEKKDGERRPDGEKKDGARRPDGEKKAGERRPDGEKKKDGDRPGEKGAEANGRDKSLMMVLIRKIDLEKGTLLCQSITEDKRGNFEYNLTSKDMKVDTSYGVQHSLRDLSEGMRAYLKLNDQDVVAIRAEWMPQWATFATVDAEKGKVTWNHEGQSKELTVKDDARIMIAGKAGKVSDLKANQRLKMVTTLDRKQILAIDVPSFSLVRPGEGEGGPRVEGKERDRLDGRPGLFGVVTEVDAAKGQVTLLINREGETSFKTITLTDAPIKFLLEGREAKDLKFADVAKGAQLAIRMDEDGKTVKEAYLQPVRLQGVVKSVDAAARKITISKEDSEKSFDVSPDARIVLGREATGLDNLRAGVTVILLLSPDRSQVLGLMVAPRRDGERE